MKDQNVLQSINNIAKLITIIIISIFFISVFIVTFFQQQEYVLWCVNSDGIKTSFTFSGLNANDINAVEQCRKMVYNPVTHYVVQK